MIKKIFTLILLIGSIIFGFLGIVYAFRENNWIALANVIALSVLNYFSFKKIFKDVKNKTLYGC